MDTPVTSKCACEMSLVGLWRTSVPPPPLLFLRRSEFRPPAIATLPRTLPKPSLPLHSFHPPFKLLYKICASIRRQFCVGTSLVTTHFEVILRTTDKRSIQSVVALFCLP